MVVETRTLTIETQGHTDIVDITDKARQALSDCGLKEGQLTVFIGGATAGVTTLEFEPGLLKDLPAAFEKIAPTGGVYHHDATWGDGNGAAHVRAALLGPKLVVPFVDARLLLGTWQQIVILDFDNRPRRREIVLQFFGE